ncbi:hypothetical protein DY000_02034596 [Brassica cretica]|uniref:Uncharacterized protein n=1 Tax=Brassica cretica TaxID=69181 RepID=A0ABQ7DEA2_BRACR|nr:hypothetical protein DY000_02034596 [Brassica cretica]
MSLDISDLLLFRFITFSYLLSPSHHYTVTSPMLKLTVMSSPHVCYSSPPLHICYNSPSFQSMEKRKIHDAIEEEEDDGRVVRLFTDDIMDY